MKLPFTKDTTIKPFKKIKKSHLKRNLYMSLAVAGIVWSSLAVYGTVEFYNTHNFQTPIVIKFQNPVPLKDTDMISPVGSKSAGFIKQAYAEEKNPYDAKSPQGIGWQVNKDMFGTDQWEAFDAVITKESGWNPYALNSSSNACGIPQALPCSKMNCEKWDYECQIKWAANYIKQRYGSPMKALEFHFKNNWY